MDLNGKRLFLYLAQPEHSAAWINGGKIPLRLASSYKSDVRDGIMTPDENLIYNSQVPIEALSPAIVVEGNFLNFTATNNYFNGVRLPDVANAKRYSEDGLILSFSQTRSEDLMKRLGKSCCVEIAKPALLLEALEKKLGKVTMAGPCFYTSDHQRNHFLKSVDDGWQDEFRLFWSQTDSAEVWVQIPPVGSLVNFGQVTSALAEHVPSRLVSMAAQVNHLSERDECDPKR